MVALSLSREKIRRFLSEIFQLKTHWHHFQIHIHGATSTAQDLYFNKFMLEKDILNENMLSYAMLY